MTESKLVQAPCRIIPAIDLIDGKCVRLSQGDYSQRKSYSAKPLDLARQFADWGIQYLHLVDLDGAKAGKIQNWRVLEQICNRTDLWVDFGGGIKLEEDLRIAFECGARQVNVGSTAVKEPDRFHEWLSLHGPECIILGADARDGKIAIHGWQTTTQLDLFAYLAEHIAAGVQTVVCTDISKDGMLAGPATDLYRDLLDAYPDINLVASGGVSNESDIEALIEVGVDGIIIGKALYEGKLNLASLKPFLP